VVFLALKELQQPTLSRSGDMAMDFLTPSQTVAQLKDSGESRMKASLAKVTPHGYEVGYEAFTINGRMLGHGERVLFHILHGSATENSQSCTSGPQLPRDRNGWQLSAETSSCAWALVENGGADFRDRRNEPHSGSWIMGDLADDDRHHGMGIVVEYAGYKGKPQWTSDRSRGFTWRWRPCSTKRIFGGDMGSVFLLVNNRGAVRVRPSF